MKYILAITIFFTLLFSSGSITSATPPVRACSDGIDNDLDGLIDYPADPGCVNKNDRDEFNAAPPPPPPPVQCADGIDNDSDGKIDLVDPGCVNSSDDDETDAPPSGDPPGPLYIDFNPATGTLQPWYRMQRANQNYYVSDFPTGISNPCFIGIVPDPLGQQGNVYKLTVEPECNYTSGSGADTSRVDLWMHSGSQTGWNAEGNEIWERTRVMFPANGEWRPSPSTWNWWLQHHNILSGVPGTGIVFGVDGRTSISPTPQLFVRVTGGDVLSPTPVTEFRWTAGVQTNHWYDMLTRIVWRTNNTGIFEWYMDGQLIYSVTRSTLAYNSSSGVRDQPNYEFSNYRNNQPWASTIYYGRTFIGSTRTSVGG